MTPAVSEQLNESILVVGPAWVGDMVMANSLFQLLKSIYPQSKITVLSPQWCLPLLERMSEVDDAIELPFKHGDFSFAKRWAFGKTLRHRGFTRAFVLPNSWKSAIIPLATKVGIRTGWLGEMRYVLLNDWRKLNKARFETMVSRFNALAYSKNSSQQSHQYPEPKLRADPDQQQATKKTFGLVEKNFIALCPGAEFGIAKRWPPKHYANLCQQLLEAKQQPVLLGSPKDAQTCEEIFAFLTPQEQQQVINLAGKTTLTQVIDLLASSTAVITNDSGLMHIAAAFDRPLVAIYGPTSKVFTPPLSTKAKVLQLNLDCQPCHQRACPLKAENQHHACMRNITPEAVMSVLRSFTEVLSQAEQRDHA